MNHAAWLRRIAALACLAAASGCSFDHVTGAARSVSVPPQSALALGSNFTCGIITDGTGYCWGANDVGQSGNGLVLPSGFPTAIAAKGPFIAMSASEASACALETSGSAVCWGFLPDGDRNITTSAVPVEFHSSVHLESLTVGDGFACGLDGSGAAYCWGLNNLGQLGVGDTLPRDTPTPVLGGLRFTQLSAGFAHACGATASGTAYCWGDDGAGQIGISARAERVLQPIAVNTSVPLRSVAAGSVYTCAIAESGLAYCWGINTGGQLGDGTTTPHRSPEPISGGLRFTAISADRGASELEHTCGITVSGAAYCWGANSFGEVGGPAETACIAFAGAAVCNRTAVAVRDLDPVIAIDAGLGHTCAITRAGVMKCWGDNSLGELGDGSRTQQATPVAISGDLRFH
jgi:alpha-tubulin suppressor-like RCC1 family protein